MADLPLDIIETILTRLPVKSLIRFQSVSKAWQAMILNPRFAKSHLQVSQNSSQNLFFLSESTFNAGSCGFRLVKLENQQFRTDAVWTYPNGPAMTLCSCNGVVLLMRVNTFERILVLCNPSNRMHKMIPCPIKYGDNYFRTNYGLCYDPRLDDYKIVIITRKKYIVYSSKKDTWTEKNINIIHNGEINMALIKARTGMFMNGAFYWVNEENKHEIIKFDVTDEKFTKLKKPMDIKDKDKFFLTELGGCLCLYSKWRDMKEVQVWIMQVDQSWKRLITIDDLHLQALHTKKARPICFTNENDIRFSISRSRFVTYSLCENKFGEIQRFPRGWWPPIVPCLDTLIFPGVQSNMDQPQDQDQDQDDEE